MDGHCSLGGLYYVQESLDQSETRSSAVREVEVVVLETTTDEAAGEEREVYI